MEILTKDTVWIGLRVMLSDDVPVHHLQNTSPRSPSYFRRPERRKAAFAGAAAEEGLKSDITAAEEAKEKSSVEVLDKVTVLKVDNFELCDFKTDFKT